MIVYSDQIEVNSSLRQNVIFPCGQWLAREMGDGEIERALTPLTDDNGESSEGKFDHYNS